MWRESRSVQMAANRLGAPAGSAGASEDQQCAELEREPLRRAPLVPHPRVLGAPPPDREASTSDLGRPISRRLPPCTSPCSPPRPPVRQMDMMPCTEDSGVSLPHRPACYGLRLPRSTACVAGVTEAMSRAPRRRRHTSGRLKEAAGQAGAWHGYTGMGTEGGGGCVEARAGAPATEGLASRVGTRPSRRPLALVGKE